MSLSGTLMVQGTTSDAGKTTVVAALCRILARQQIKVAPFKPQNMALNSAVTECGGEIGRAQALQADAAFIPPTVDMNPVLIKPSSDCTAQIIVQGRVREDMNAREFHLHKPELLDVVLKSHSALRAQFNVVVAEGAGSPAEINLRKGDIANMGFAESADCPVVLVADIDKGGVFAQLVGTLQLLSESEQERIKGFIINKFRGDVSLLQPGLDWLEEKTGKPVFGVVPYLKNLFLEEEDGLNNAQVAVQENHIKVIVPVLPRISNHTDFDALKLHPNVDFSFCAIEDAPLPCDLIILPGSKSVADDFKSLQGQGWGDHIRRHLRYGGKVMGICGGLQMLGRGLRDDLGVESDSLTRASSSIGFDLLPIETAMLSEKTLKNRSGTLRLCGKEAPVTGYEIHHGETTSPEVKGHLIAFDDGGSDGFLSHDGQVFATYLHGVFDHPEAAEVILSWAGLNVDDSTSVDVDQLREQNLDRLANEVEKHLDIPRLKGLFSKESAEC